MKVEMPLKFIILNTVIVTMFTIYHKKGLYWRAAIVSLMTPVPLNLENYMLVFVEYYLLNT